MEQAIMQVLAGGADLVIIGIGLVLLKHESRIKMVEHDIMRAREDLERVRNKCGHVV